MPDLREIQYRQGFHGNKAEKPASTAFQQTRLYI